MICLPPSATPAQRIDRAVMLLQIDVSRYGDWDRLPDRTARMYAFLLHERTYVTAREAEGKANNKAETTATRSLQLSKEIDRLRRYIVVYGQPMPDVLANAYQHVLRQQAIARATRSSPIGSRAR